VNDTTTTHYLPPGLPVPVPEPDSLSAPYWSGLREGRLRVQHCAACGTWQFGPEWLCHRCHAFDPAWEEVAPRGRIFSWERVWHPAHAALKGHGAYLVSLWVSKLSRVQVRQPANSPSVSTCRSGRRWNAFLESSFTKNGPSIGCFRP
jgi:hypothetical protein